MVLGGKIISTVLGTEPFFQRLKERNSPLKDWKYDRMMTSEEWQERLHGQKRTWSPVVQSQAVLTRITRSLSIW